MKVPIQITAMHIHWQHALAVRISADFENGLCGGIYTLKIKLILYDFYWPKF